MSRFFHIMASRTRWPKPLRSLSDAELEEGAVELPAQLVIPETPREDVELASKTCGAYCRIRDRQRWIENTD